MTVPNTLIAGDTWQWTRDLSDYPSGTWTLTYYLRQTGQTITVVASASGTTHSVAVAAATTAAYAPGRYKWQARVSYSGEVFTVEEGWVEVEPNPATTTTDTRSWARQTLDAVECFLKGNASSAQQAMTIQGRSISRWALADLMKFRDQLRNEVRTEELGSNAGLGRNIKVRFARG